MKVTLLIPSLLTAAFAVSCTPLQQQGASVGALGGAAIGALTGKTSTDIARGAAIGAAAGAGAAVVKEQHEKSQGAYNTGGNQTPQVSQTAPPPQYLVATTTSTPGHVRSPYAPYQVVNVKGFKSGQLAKVPGTNQVFRLP